MKNFILTIFLSLSTISFSQIQNNAFEEYIKTFEYNFNNSHFEEIFKSFNNEMKNDLPKENAISFFSSLMKVSGKINKIEYDSSKDSFNIYKIYLDKKNYLFFLSLDNNSKVDGIYFEEEK
ncbi:MAG: DUF3887 domain-containing protein [Cetobacterium sp.]|uniref:DUF3887 domain-containing protein n=1 Tax=Cetobacterium sp. TaxID=2071632 RepID=UPI003F392F8D